MNWFFEAHSLWRDILLSIDTSLGPASSDPTDFVDSLWETSSSLRSRWGWGGSEGKGSRRRGGRGKWDWYTK